MIHMNMQHWKNNFICFVAVLFLFWLNCEEFMLIVYCIVKIRWRLMGVGGGEKREGKEGIVVSGIGRIG